jgi:deazaflavin-dependent oxidoreductase (nitroreductase family)
LSPAVNADGEPEFLYLTTTGRRTGLAREIEIWFTAADGRYYVVAEHGPRARWVQNVIADDRVRVRVGPQAFVARARLVNGGDEPALARKVRKRSEDKYGWGDGLVVELTPQP